MNQESKSGLAELQNCRLRLQLSEGLTGTGEFFSKTATRMVVGKTVPYYLGFSIGLPECLHNLAAGFPRTSDPRKEETKIEVTVVFMP